MLASLDQLKQWQTLIGAVLGFGGLMVAALWNSHLNRKRDTLLRNDEANSVAAALYGEILLLRREAAAVAEIVADFITQHRDVDAEFVKNHPFSEPKIYQALASKLGLLSVVDVLGIAKFHQNLREARGALPLLVPDSQKGFFYTSGSFLRPVVEAARNVLPTMRRIEARLKVAPHNEDTDLILAATIVELEEAEFQRQQTE